MNKQTQKVVSNAIGMTAIEADDRVLETQISRLITGSGFSNLAGIAMAVIWVGLIWNDLPQVVLSVWLAVMMFLF